MCCGSGSFLAEVLKAAKEKLGITGIVALHEVVTGFDIDPLAVSLSKTTWVATLADEIRTATTPIDIPVFHADSLFTVTPLSAKVPFFDEAGPVEISLDGTVVRLPHELVQPEYRELFDRIVEWAYDEAIEARAKKSAAHLTESNTKEFLDGAGAATGLRSLKR